jgi:hypothetical protein
MALRATRLWMTASSIDYVQKLFNFPRNNTRIVHFKHQGSSRLVVKDFPHSRSFIHGKLYTYPCSRVKDAKHRAQRLLVLDAVEGIGMFAIIMNDRTAVLIF